MKLFIKFPRQVNIPGVKLTHHNLLKQVVVTVNGNDSVTVNNVQKDKNNEFLYLPLNEQNWKKFQKVIKMTNLVYVVDQNKEGVTIPVDATYHELITFVNNGKSYTDKYDASHYYAKRDAKRKRNQQQRSSVEGSTEESKPSNPKEDTMENQNTHQDTQYTEYNSREMPDWFRTIHAAHQFYANELMTLVRMGKEKVAKDHVLKLQGLMNDVRELIKDDASRKELWPIFDFECEVLSIAMDSATHQHADRVEELSEKYIKMADEHAESSRSLRGQATRNLLWGTAIGVIGTLAFNYFNSRD